jgi:alpha-tubulin suppressor-like RCC1 family protein
VVEIVAAGFHACAVVSSGGVQCWGQNVAGQLGNGTTTLSAVPVAVTGLSGVASIAGGYSHQCALTTAGGVSCWGDNTYGQLGITGVSKSTTPVAVTGLASGVTSLGGGGENNHMCAVVGGAAECWGDNQNGQLGNNTTIGSSAPVAVMGLGSGVAGLAAGADHTCAMMTSGSVLCWGGNADGQLGNGTTTESHVPIAVSGITNARAIAAGYHLTCAALLTGAVKCWGVNTIGQLGNGTTTSSSVPVTVTGLANALLVGAGDTSACALTTPGAAWCWGADNVGQLGDGTGTSSSVPVAVTGISTTGTQISCGGNGSHACALVGGVPKCWGYNMWGELGDNSGANSLVPVGVVEP